MPQSNIDLKEIIAALRFATEQLNTHVKDQEKEVSLKKWNCEKTYDTHIRGMPTVYKSRFDMLKECNLADGLWRDFIIQAVHEKLTELEKNKTSIQREWETRYLK